MFGLKDIGSGIFITEDIYRKKRDGKRLKEIIFGSLDFRQQHQEGSFGLKDIGS
jgi:hypothetical protein